MTWTRGILLGGPSTLVESVRARWKAVQVPLGTSLLTQGEIPGSAFLLASGLVKLWRGNDAGKVAIVGLRGDGWILGFPAVMLDSASVVSATTLVRCQVHAIPSTELRKWLHDDPQAAYSALEMTVREVREQLVERSDLGMVSAKARLEQLLWSLAVEAPIGDTPHPAHLHLPIRLGELAQFLSVTPQYLSGLLAGLRSRGTITTSRGALVVTRPDQLKHTDGDM